MIIIYLLLFIVAAICIAAAVLPKGYRVARHIVIKRTHSEVFDYIRLLRNQNNYSAWATIDPNLQQTFTGVDGEVGFVSAWESTDKNLGKGAQEITGIFPNEKLTYELRFEQPRRSTAQGYLAVKSLSAAETEVSWVIEGAIPMPFNLFLLLMNMDKMIGNDFEKGLQNLKNILEKP